MRAGHYAGCNCSTAASLVQGHPAFIGCVVVWSVQHFRASAAWLWLLSAAITYTAHAHSALSCRNTTQGCLCVIPGTRQLLHLSCMWLPRLVNAWFWAFVEPWRTVAAAGFLSDVSDLSLRTFTKLCIRSFTQAEQPPNTHTAATVAEHQTRAQCISTASPLLMC